ncbi:MAG TPA: response regulator transcription factor [Dehalococcoidia bacterium]|jgi:CheY-like chemotaxis protein|nr:response regulator transcription factor [Dehalococcoidia bacterium]
MTPTRTILVIDDDPGLLRLLSVVFRAEGFIVQTFDDPQPALEWLATAAQPDAVVLDLRMPEMDGRSFYREMRGRGFNAPVVIASAFGAKEAREELGADASIGKPFHPDDLVRVVRGVFATDA